MQGFLSGGSSPDCQKTAPTTFVLVINLFNCFTEGAQWLFQSKLDSPRFQEVPTLTKGAGPTFSRVNQMLNSIETDITCDISRGSGPPIPTSGSVHDWIRIG